MKKTYLDNPILVRSLSLLSGCSAVLYTGHQDLARQSFENLSTSEERIACRHQNSISYDHIDKQRQDLRDSGPTKKTVKNRNAALCFKLESNGQIVCPN